jgi:hypothetical protein
VSVPYSRFTKTGAPEAFLLPLTRTGKSAIAGGLLERAEEPLGEGAHVQRAWILAHPTERPRGTIRTSGSYASAGAGSVTSKSVPDARDVLKSLAENPSCRQGCWRFTERARLLCPLDAQTPGAAARPASLDVRLSETRRPVGFP